MSRLEKRKYYFTVSLDSSYAIRLLHNLCEQLYGECCSCIFKRESGLSQFNTHMERKQRGTAYQIKIPEFRGGKRALVTK